MYRYIKSAFFTIITLFNVFTNINQYVIRKFVAYEYGPRPTPECKGPKWKKILLF